MKDFAQVRRIKQRKFLRQFAQCGVVLRAAEAAGCNANSHYHWLKHDPDYAEAFELAREMAADQLESVAWDRAQKSSDLLLIFLLKALRPEKYREQRVIVGDSSSPVKHEMRISVVRTDDRENYLPAPKALGPAEDCQ